MHRTIIPFLGILIILTKAGDLDSERRGNVTAFLALFLFHHGVKTSHQFPEAANQYLRDSFIRALVMKQDCLIKLDPGPLMAA